MSKETKRLEEIIERLKKEQSENDKNLLNWVADNIEFGLYKDSTHYYHLENKIIPCTIDQILIHYSERNNYPNELNL